MTSRDLASSLGVIGAAAAAVREVHDITGTVVRDVRQGGTILLHRSARVLQRLADHAGRDQALLSGPLFSAQFCPLAEHW